MKSMQFAIVAIVCVAAAGARAQSFEWQLFQISQNASVLAGPSRRAFLAPGAQMAALQGPVVWQKVIGFDGTFTAEMPGTPIYSKYDEDPAFTHHQYYLVDGNRIFRIGSMIYPPSYALISNPQEYLQKLQDAWRKGWSIDGEWISVTWMKHQGLAAVEVIGLTKGRTHRSLFVVRGRQYFSATYIGPDGTARSEDTNRFISSLNIR